MEFLTSVWTFVFLGMPVWFWLFIIFCFCMLILMIIDKVSRNKKFWKENDLKNAKPMVHTSGGLTPPFGTEVIYINPHKWVIIDWDRHENYLNIWEPRHTYKTPEEYKLGHGKLNWRVTHEVPKTFTTVEQHFKRQVM
jgi:hypothetical protein